MFAGGAGWGFIPCFSLLLSLSSSTLRSCACVCVCAWSVPLAPSFAFLTYLLAIPLFSRGSWPSPIARACARCEGGAGVGFHTMFLFDLVSVFFHLAALCTLGYVCVVRPLGALPRIFNILVRLFFSLFLHGPWPAHTFCAFFFFSSCISRCSEPMEEYWGYMVVVQVCGHALLRAWWFVVLFCVRRCPLGALLHNILGFLIYACVAGDMICRMYGAVTYLIVIPLFSRGPWSCFLCLWFGVYLFVLFPSFFF